ncbi:hypothetical protein B4065_0318 [Caldibacillus thermoamylovorans]|nr:hypothetical protein B4065_0318 [Caldibacillus thermoamylovorans]
MSLFYTTCLINEIFFAEGKYNFQLILSHLFIAPGASSKYATTEIVHVLRFTMRSDFF